LSAVARQHGATACFFNRDYEPYAITRDAGVTVALQTRGVMVRSFRVALE